MDDFTCKVCNCQYPGRLKKCPRCGCPKGGTVPALLRCSRCGTVLSSRKKLCPECGQVMSPRTATVAFLPQRTAASRRRSILKWTAGIIVALAVLTAEGLFVENYYANIAYRQSVNLWNCGGSVEANRRSPDPIYQEPEPPVVPDSLFYDDVPAADSVEVMEVHPLLTAPDSTDY